MNRLKEHPNLGFQLDLNSPENIKIFLFPKGTIIYPQDYPRGVTLEESVPAIKLSIKIYGLTGYQSNHHFTGYHDKHFYSFAKQTQFGAYASSAKHWS